MKIKNLTERFPFLLPIRKRQRRFFFYLKMRFDSNKYSKEKSEKLQFKSFQTKNLMINKDSGFPMEYQIDKVHNLRLASQNIKRIIIKPNEVFSFWQIIKDADKYEKYKKGLVINNGQMVSGYGGGLCELSSMLYFMFLNTPLTIIERHPHRVQVIPQNESVIGIDAAVMEGWLDLKVKNETRITFQIDIDFDEKYMYGTIYSDIEDKFIYEIFNREINYIKDGQRIVEKARVYKRAIDKENKEKKEKFLYENKTEIGYELPRLTNEQFISWDGETVARII